MAVDDARVVHGSVDFRLSAPFRADRRLVVLVRVERRVGVDEVGAFRVQPPQDVEVVPRPYGAVGEVRSASHGRRLSARGRCNDLPLGWLSGSVVAGRPLLVTPYLLQE